MIIFLETAPSRRQLVCIQIAIDGHAGSGKQTLGKRLARKLGVIYLDTGLLYRGVTVRLIEVGGDPRNSRHCELACADFLRRMHHFHNDYRLRSPEVDLHVSTVSAHSLVRTMLKEFQITTANDSYGAVLDGRDIGMSIMPEASVKFFVTAEPAVRARRRMLQYPDAQQNFDLVLASIMRRDAEDERRADSPLTRAPNSNLIDTTCLTADEVYIEAVDIVAPKLVQLLRGY